MGWITTNCPHCGKEIEHQYDDFNAGYDHRTYTDCECDYCEKEYDIEIVSENIYVESILKSAPRED